MLFRILFFVVRKETIPVSFEFRSAFTKLSVEVVGLLWNSKSLIGIELELGLQALNVVGLERFCSLHVSYLMSRVTGERTYVLHELHEFPVVWIRNQSLF